MSAFPTRENLGLSQSWICSGLRDVSTNWLSPGASGARGTTNASDYLHVLVLRSRNAKELIEQGTSSDSFSSCPVWFPWPFDHTALCTKTLSSIPSSKVACDYISTWLWSLEAGTQLTISWDPEISSLVLNFCPFSPNRFIKQSPYKIYGWL